ncbi:alpha/beta hydrolase family protein [Lysobacter brunescens]|uniref:Alpha/beta hydrolase family protein n=1 Tax=Lysobacter brunescens TaxID=262323 RepID=A0ABW2Y7L5_9GAMM
MKARRRRSGAPVRASVLRVVLAAMLAMSFAAFAKVREIPPGELPRLADGEGLVAIVVDTRTPLREVHFRDDVADAVVVQSATLRNLPAGATARLYALPAGEYRWHRLTTLYGLRYLLHDRPEHRFRVEAGVLNYPGDLIVRDVISDLPRVQLSNRALQAIDWLDEVHPGLGERVPLRYTGRYPDPFPAFYRAQQALAGKPHTALSDVRRPPAPGALPLPVRELWRRERISRADLSPRGDRLVKVLHDAQGDHLELVPLPGGQATPLMRMCCPIETMGWAGSDVFVVATRAPGTSIVHLRVFRFRAPGEGEPAFDMLERWMNAQAIEILPERDDIVLVSSRDRRGRLMVHRLRIDSTHAMTREAFDPATKLNRGVDGDLAWFSDGRGRLRVAVAAVGEDGENRENRSMRRLLHGADGDHVEVLRHPADTFTPISLSFDGARIYGLGEPTRNDDAPADAHGGGQRDLLVFDTATGRLSTLFSRPGVDVVAPILDGAREPVGAMYHQDGHLVSEYFDAAAPATNALLQSMFPGRSVVASDRAADGDLLAWVEAADDPGGLFHIDLDADTDAGAPRATRIESEAPWLDGRAFAPSTLLRAVALDGSPIEAYLTRPPGSGRTPLVLLLHGGPVGVRDARGFDREVQFLASLGYAVLQVNFRGSDGFGSAFRSAARRAQGTLIEDDIDAVLATVLDDPGIDRERVCAIGASYGGYSSMVSAMRWPGRFRCVVSMSGLTDLLLFFTASDSGSTASGRDALVRAFGDPDTDAEVLLGRSPAYRFRELGVPLMLVHGDDDLRVDFEHTRRLVRMLNIAGTKPTLLTVRDAGHAFETLDDVEAVWTGVAGFLRRHLGPGVQVAASSSPPAQDSVSAPRSE